MTVVHLSPWKCSNQTLHVVIILQDLWTGVVRLISGHFFVFWSGSQIGMLRLMYCVVSKMTRLYIYVWTQPSGASSCRRVYIIPSSFFSSPAPCVRMLILHAAESFLKSEHVLSYSRNSTHVMETECSLPHLQKPATCLSWARSIQSMIPSHLSTRWFKYDRDWFVCKQAALVRSYLKHLVKSILILFSHLRLGLPSSLVASGFPTKTLYSPLLFPIRATCPAYSSNTSGLYSGDSQFQSLPRHRMSWRRSLCFLQFLQVHVGVTTTSTYSVIRYSSFLTAIVNKPLGPCSWSLCSSVLSSAVCKCRKVQTVKWRTRCGGNLCVDFGLGT